MQIWPLANADSGCPLTRLNDFISGTGFRARVIRTVAGTSGVQLGGMAFAFLIGAQLAHGIGPAGYGIYSVGMSIASLLGIPTEFGLPQLLTREVTAARVRGDWPRMLGAILFGSSAVALSSIAIGVCGEIVLWTTDLVSNPEQREVLGWGMLLIPVVGQTKLCGVSLQGLGSITLGQFANLLLRPGLFALSLFLAVYAFSTRLTPSTAMGLQVSSAFVTLLAASILLFSFLPKEVRVAKPVFFTRSWIVSALPLAITEGMRVVQGNMAIILLGLLATKTEVGLFRVADSTASMCGLAISILNVVAQPLIAGLWAGAEHARLQRLVGVFAMIMTVGTLAAVIPLLLGGSELLSLVFGPRFAPAESTLVISCLSLAPYALFGPCMVLLNMTHNERRVTFAILCSVIANLLVSAILIPRFGAPGAAWGSVAGATIWNGILWLNARKLMGIDTSVFGLLIERLRKPAE